MYCCRITYVIAHNSASSRKSNSDGTFSFIPFNDENGEFQIYKKWLADGNTPDDSD